jgi:glycosyltransferase involved in cell wall biosynthesis
MTPSLSFFIYSLSGGGAERATTTLANYWAAKGWRIAIITIASRADDFYQIDPSIKRISLDLAHNANGPLVATWYNFRRIFALRHALKATKPELVIAMMTSANVVLAFASLGLGHRRIGAEHIHPPQLPLGRVWEFLRRQTYGFLHAVTALTHQSADWIRLNTNARKVVVIPNPILWPLPSHEPTVRTEEVCKPGRRIVLAVGRLAPQKQFHVLLEAFARVCTARSEWDLVILGDGPERPSLQALVKSRALTEKIFLPGTVGNIGDWYARANIFALTSRFEGFPYALVEAMAYGLAVLSYDCDTGPREILSHGQTGILVPPSSTEGIAEALLRLMNDEQLRSKMGQRATEIRERLSLERIAGQWEHLFLVQSSNSQAKRE